MNYYDAMRLLDKVREGAQYPIHKINKAFLAEIPPPNSWILLPDAGSIFPPPEHLPVLFYMSS